MKKYFQSLSVLLVMGLVMGSTVSAAVTTGQMAPDFTLTDSHENERSLSDYKGKYVILEWVNYDCPFVKKHYNSMNMQNLQKEYTSQGVIWLSINSSAHGQQGHLHPEEINALVQEKGAAPTAFLVDADGDVGHLYGAQTTPHMYIIDPQGVLIYQGAIDSIPSPNPADIAKADNYVKDAMNAAMSGQPVSMSSTKSYGCSVKY
jgi:peroxiredoxin